MLAELHRTIVVLAVTAGLLVLMASCASAQVDLQSQIARKFDLQGFHQPAITHYTLALTSERPAAAADTLSLIGKDYDHLGQYENALKSYRRSFATAQKISDRRRQVSALTSVADTYLLQNKFDQALLTLQQSQHLAQTIHDFKGEAKTLRILADLANSQSRYDQAAAYGKKGLSLAQAHGDRGDEGELWASLGTSAFWLGHYDQAIHDYSRSLMIARTIHDPQMEGDALGFLGNSYNGLSDFSHALTFYKQALILERKVNDYDGIEGVLGNSGNVSLFLSQYSQASRYYTLALKSAVAIHDYQGASVWLNQLGQASRYLGRYSKAIGFYQQAAAIARRQHGDEVLGMSLSDIGEAYWLLKKYGPATESFQEALQIAARTHNLETQQWALVNQGNVYLDQHQNDQATDYYQRALAVARETGTKRAIGYCLYRLMLVEKAKDDPGLAVFYGKQAVNTWQQIRRGLTSLDLSTQKSFVVYREDSYRQLAALLIDLGRLPEAQQVLDLLKTQEFSDFVRGDPRGTTGVSGQSELTAQEDAAAAQYAQIAGDVISLGQRKQVLLDKKQTPGGAAFSAADQTQLDRTNAELSVANTHLRAFLTQLSSAFRAPTAENLPLQERLQSIKNAFGLQNTLRQLHAQGQDTVVLETVLTPDRYAVIVTTAQSQKVEQFPISTADLNQKLLLFRQALQDPEADPRGPAQDLYRVLVAPIEADLQQAGAHTLMWSLDGSLRYIPIAALYDGHAYLAERYVNEVFTLGSQSGFGHDEHASWEGLGMGVSLPLAGSGFQPLPAVPGELHGIIRDETHSQGVIPGEVLLNADFTQSAMDHALEEQKYNLVHIASHFSVKAGDSDKSYLLLGDGSRLSLTQLASAAQVFQGVDTLTLSACNTAMGRIGADGKEVDSLGTIAQQQGAATVVASLWPVSDASTMMLMSQFYHWREAHPQDSKAEALRQAQLAVMHGTVAPPDTYHVRGSRTRSGDSTISLAPDLPPFTPVPNAPFAHPFYWATFVLFGNWR